MNTTRLLAAFSVAGLLSTSAIAGSNQYPGHVIRLIVPFPAGGGTDTAARQMAELLTNRLKTDVIVDNRPGAGGSIGALSVTKSAPDGYTLLVGTVGTQIVNKIMFPTTGLDPEKDFVPVGWFSSVPNVLVVSSASQYRSVQDLIAAAKAKPNGLIYGSGGTGSTPHLAVELLKDLTGIRLTHVPYKGSAPALVDLIGGQVDFAIDNLSAAKPMIEGGKLRVLAVTTKTRLKSYPNVPALSEMPGLSSYEAVGWTGLFAPKGTDQKIVEILSRAMSSSANADEWKRRVENTGASFVGAGSEKFSEFLKVERSRWLPIAERSTQP